MNTHHGYTIHPRSSTMVPAPPKKWALGELRSIGKVEFLLSSSVCSIQVSTLSAAIRPKKSGFLLCCGGIGSSGWMFVCDECSGFAADLLGRAFFFIPSFTHRAWIFFFPSPPPPSVCLLPPFSSQIWTSLIQAHVCCRPCCSC
jgi:hypothetical protein